MMSNERKTLIMAFFAIIVNSSLNLVGPLIIGHTIDKYVQTKQFHGVLVFSGVLLSIYLFAFVLQPVDQILFQQREENDARRFLDLIEHAVKLLLAAHQRIDMLHRVHIGVLIKC